MEKLKKNYGEFSDPVVLYYDDLEKIVEILKEASNNLEIITDSYKFQSLDEFKNQIVAEKVNFLEIKIRNPHISLNFKPNEIWIYAEEDSLVSAGIIQKVKQILNKRKLKLYWLTKHSWIWGAFMGGSLWFFIPPADFLKRIPYNEAIGISVLILGIYLSWYCLNYLPKNYSVIYLKNKSLMQSFWLRKKDDILLLIIGTIIGTVATFLLTHYLS